MQENRGSRPKLETIFAFCVRSSFVSLRKKYESSCLTSSNEKNEEKKRKNEQRIRKHMQEIYIRENARTTKKSCRSCFQREQSVKDVRFGCRSDFLLGLLFLCESINTQSNDPARLSSRLFNV